VKPYVYIMRLVAFSFIIYAIYDKNRATTAPPKSNPPA
jgi:hypothetical protein